MALPLAPVAGFALRYGAVALATYAVVKAAPSLPRSQRVEDTLDTVEEGLSARRDSEQANATGRYRRVIQFGKNGPALEIDAVALTRVRVRRIR
ncbi:MAG: hypothetical protein AAGI10_11685 [Pseudomonadota bacterium]